MCLPRSSSHLVHLARHAFRAAALLLATTPALTLAQQGTGTITGRVTGEGSPLPGATVAVSGTMRGATAGNDGTYRVTLPPGRYELRARLIGYASARDSVTVIAGSSVRHDFTLARSATTLDAVAVIGSRGEERTVITAPVPIDVLSAVEIRQTGRTETAQMIQMAAPSVNFPRASIGDGTDHVRPATLRGLAPDQTLVLINGKRRHSSALVNVNGTIGRGSTMVDLNAIPGSMIERVEILRDGAAAQYGSDAIAGVMNIVLKRGPGGEVTTTLGRNETTLEGFGKKTDGAVFHTNADYGLSFAQTGYLHVGAELRDRGHTNRSLPDPRTQYFANDPRNSGPAPVNHRQGDAYVRDLGTFLNAGRSFENGIELYAFGGFNARKGEAAGFFRRPNDDRTVRALAPNGFLPLIASDILDGSLTAGAKGARYGWKWDLSSVYGSNSFRFDVKNSMNTSMGSASPRDFYAGTLSFGQSTTNLDLFRELAVAALPKPVRLGVGGEFRRDAYGIEAGEENSYKDGGVRIMDGPNAGRLAAVGAQVFPGFKPQDARDVSRNNVAGYVDLEADVTRRIFVGLAGRTERYSDFGTTTNGKVSGRFEVVKQLAVRGAASTGFRAPALAQQHFSSTATNFINGVPFDIRTFPVESAEAKVLGAQPLQPERSKNLSVGVAVEPWRALSLTVDAYRIDIDDRIVFSENFTGAAIQALFERSGMRGVTGGRFFTNAIDTRTEGVDVVTNFGVTLPNRDILRLSGAFNRNYTRVERVATTPPQLSGFDEQLFGRVERARIERGQPQNNVVLSANYSHKKLGAALRSQRFGEVTSFATATNGSLDQTFAAKWITDANVSYELPRRITLMLGADNLMDVYPDRNSMMGNATTAGNSNFGIFPYSGISPFGFNGRFVYARLSAGL